MKKNNFNPIKEFFCPGVWKRIKRLDW